MTKRQQRMAAVTALLAGLALAAVLGVTAFRKNLMYFYTPSDLVAGKASAGTSMRLGGLVETGSLSRGEGLAVRFVLADCQDRVPVVYEGILPDLFREGQGIVATGRWSGPEQGFVADQVLAKHDENYMPPELAASLKGKDGTVHSCEAFKPVVSS
ncbi:MAG TPA: cytochrome c maturation protein CcmE [Nevskiaceae bacterium]|nr:cytochrome c maturation protein CcmE [Nevskiaceae bacterium]